MITLTREEAQQVMDALEYAYDNEMFVDIRSTLRARLSAPEPEPVAWMLTELDGTPLIDCGDLVVKPRPVLVSDKTDCIPLYTAPPQREWVGLTDEEIYEAVENSNSVLIKDMARAIEAKLKEKNG